jgi:hypothetical protein
MTSRLAALALSLLSVPFSLGCRDLERFDTKEDQAYCGDLVSGGDVASGMSFDDGFWPDGEPKLLRMQLTELKTNLLSTFSSDTSSFPAWLTSNDAESGLCAEQSQALFEHAPLRSIPQIDHDSIATLSFGEGHDRDFFAWVDSTCQGTMLALVSLLRNNDIELRLFKPAALPPPAASAGQRPGFALFYLRRNNKLCGFQNVSADE